MNAEMKLVQIQYYLGKSIVHNAVFIPVREKITEANGKEGNQSTIEVPKVSILLCAG
jgi:hypothetical protein